MDIPKEQPEPDQEKHKTKKNLQGSWIQSLIEFNPEPGRKNCPREESETRREKDIPCGTRRKLRMPPPVEGIGKGCGQSREDHDSKGCGSHFLHIQPNQVDEKRDGHDPTTYPQEGGDESNQDSSRHSEGQALVASVTASPFPAGSDEQVQTTDEKESSKARLQKLGLKTNRHLDSSHGSYDRGAGHG